MTKEISSLSYEAARDELQQVVSQLEQQNVSLEASMALWERGEALAAHCESWLSGARKKLDETIATKDLK
jgi:exodeoxyribonuclease VII small subunit